MNPLDWDDVTIRSIQRHLNPSQQDVVEDIMEDALGANEEWNTYCKYAGHTGDEAQSSMGVNVGWNELGLLPVNFYMKNSEAEDPDGKPLEMDEEDPELARKRKELRAIEERIILKKAAIALKTVEPLVKKTTSPDFSSNESATCFALKERVNLILQQKYPGRFLSTVRSPKERIDSSSLSENGLLQDDHPLKLRVKALMKQRCSDPIVLPASREVPDLTPPPPSRNVTSPDIENGVNKGFQRFLSVLNKGVDMDLLSRIVNDDSVDLSLGEELLNIQPPVAEDMSDPTSRRESQQSDGGASLPGRSRTNSGERKTDPSSQERSLCERLSPPDNDEKMNDRSRSKSPSAVKKKRKKRKKEEKKEEEKPQVDEQREQLENVLKSLGLSLEVEEMNKLTDRTQERLYGKKHDNTRVEQESRQRGSQRHYSKSSSSSSSSSSRSTSRSYSSSPSRRRCSHSRESRRRSERGRSRDRSGDGLTCHDGNEYSKEEQTYSDKDEKYPKVISSYQHPYPPNHTYPQPAAYSAFPDTILSQDSQYTAYHSGTYSAASNSYWAPTQGAIPPSFYTSECPYSQNAYQHLPGSVVAPNMDYRPQCDSFDMNLFVNPDLSKSEGQTGSISGNRCLQVISTKQSCTDRSLQSLKKGPKKKRKRKGKCKGMGQEMGNVKVKEKVKSEPLKKKSKCNWTKRKELKIKLKLAAKEMKNYVKKLNEEDFGTEPSRKSQKRPQEEKWPPTEEEIKQNMTKKLEAFNQKVREQFPQPANSLTSQTG